MTEKPFFLDNHGTRLFAVLHEAAGTARTPFVFSHPMGEEKLWSHRVFVNYARHLAESGHPVLRFDYEGMGDSDGSFAASSITSSLADLACAVNHVRHVTGSAAVHLLGLRLGASIAALAAEQMAGVDRLVLWAPVVDGGRYMQEMLRINLTTQLATYREIRQDRDAMVEAMCQGHTVNVDGYELGLQYFTGASAIALASCAKQHSGPCLIVQVDRQPGRIMPELQQMASTYPQGTVALAQEDPFWKEIPRFYDKAPSLFAVTTDWMADRA